MYRHRVLVALALIATLAGAGAAVGADGPAVPVIKGVQTGTVSFVTSQVTSATTVTLGKAVDPTKSFVHCTFSTAAIAADQRPTCELNNTDGSTVVVTLAVTPAASKDNVATTVRWYVAEFETGVSVQRGTASFAAGESEPGTAAVTLTSVDCTKSFVLITDRANMPGGNGGNEGNVDEEWQVGATLVTSGAGSAPRAVCTSGSTTALELFRTRTGIALTIAWQVIQMDGTSVQRGQSCIGSSGTCGAVTTGATQGTSVNASLSTITANKSLILTTQRAGTAIAGNEGLYRVRADFSSTTEARFTRGVNSTAANQEIRLTWEVVSFSDTNSVAIERNTFGSDTTLAAGTGSASATFSANRYQSRTLPFVSSSYNGNSNITHNSAMIAVQTNQGNLSFTRSGTSNAVTIDWQAVQFFGCDTDPTLCHVSASALSGTTSNTASARIAWWPVYNASNTECFSASTAPSTCNVMVVRWTGTSPISFTPANGTQYTAGLLSGGGSCTATGLTAGTTTNPCVVFRGTATTTATTQLATDSPLPNDGSTQVNYKVYVQTGAPTNPTYVTLSDSLSTVAVTPKMYSASTGGLQWTYHASGGAILNAPLESSEGFVYANSNNHKVYVVNSATGAELADPVITPAAPLGAITWWPPLTGNQSQVVFGDQAGYVTSFDGHTGKRQWTRRIHTDPSDSTLGNIQASPVVQSQRYANTTFKNTYNSATYSNYTGDVLFIATANTNTGSNQNKNNKIYAIRATDGSSLWTFDPNNDNTNCSALNAMDIVLATPGVDYNANHLYVTSEDGPTAGQNSIWVVNTLGVTGSGSPSLDCRGLLVQQYGTILDSDISLWMSYDTSTFYFQSANGLLRAYDTGGTTAPRISGSTVISSAISGSPNYLIKSSFWQDFDKYLQGEARLYFVTQNGGIWCLDDLGNDFDICPEWTADPTYQNVSAKTPFAFPMLMEPRLWLPGGDNGSTHAGRGVLFQLSTADGSVQKTFLIGSCSGSGTSADCGAALGNISVSSFNYDALYFGNTAGKIFRVNLSGFYGSLP